MTKKISLAQGLGNKKVVEKYYNDLAHNYEKSLKKWNYKAPIKSAKILKKFININPKFLLDLACGTGLFGEKISKVYKDCIIDGTDISKESLKIAKKKNNYRNLSKISFEKRHNISNKYNIVSLIGAMTYCNNHSLLFNNVHFFLKKLGYFIFTQRTDLWIKYQFDIFLVRYSKKFKIIYKSRPLDYLPKNKEFQKNIKIHLVLLQKR